MGLLRVGERSILQLTVSGALTLLSTAAVYYLYRGYQVRQMFRNLQKQGIVSY